MEERRDDNEELKHVCKLCNKRYPSGKSLGGHMRSHVIANSQKNKPTIIIPKKVIHFDDDDEEDEDDDDDDVEDDDERGDEGKQSGYGLRENPKKTWRLVDSTLNNNNNAGKQQQQQVVHHFQAQERVCKQCGKGFQSLKALCGHMSSHSDKDRNFNKEEDDNSWSSDDYCKTHLISAAMESHSDNNNDSNSNLKRQTRSSLSRYKSLTAVESPSPTTANGNGGSSSNHSEIDQHEQEEVAMCLMMLSRDSSSSVHHHNHNRIHNNNTITSKPCFNITTAESSDNNSVILEGGSSSNYNNHNHNHNKRKVFCLNKDNDHGKKIKQQVAAAAAQHEMDNSDSGYFENGAKELESDDDSVDFARNYGFKRPKTEFGSKLLADSFNNYEDGDWRKSKVREMGNFSLDNSPESDENSSKKIMMKQTYNHLNSSNMNGNDNSVKKGSKYECWVCNKTFKTHQALGGHIISHRKNGAENSSLLENKTSAKKVGATTAKGVPSKAKKAKGHKCPYCPRVFKSGQALGGHKRSHMIGSNSHMLNLDRSKPERATPARLEPQQQQQQQQVQPPLLDLNLPAPMEEEGSGNSQFVAW